MGSWGSGRARFDASVGCPRLGFAFTSGYVPRAALERWRQPRKVSEANPTVHRLLFGGSSHQGNCAFRLNTSPLRHGA